MLLGPRGTGKYLCAKVEVQGRIFTGIARKPVVLVDALFVRESPDDEADDAME